ncbi:MAG: hypothetical protein AAF607_00755 [Pseudomonadota bacterium]
MTRFRKCMRGGALALSAVFTLQTAAIASPFALDRPPIIGGPLEAAQLSAGAASFDTFNPGVGAPVEIETITWWGAITEVDTVNFVLTGFDGTEGSFNIQFFEETNVDFASPLAMRSAAIGDITRTVTAANAASAGNSGPYTLFEYTFDFNTPVVLDGNTNYLLNIDHIPVNFDIFFWAVSSTTSGTGLVGQPGLFDPIVVTTISEGFAYRLSGTVVPLPSTAVMMLPVLALGALGVRRRKEKAAT